MATHARQQYFADESSLSKEKREFSIAEEVQQKIDSIEEGAQVNTIETIKVNGSEVQPDENKAVDLTIPGVVDSLDSTSSTDALSAKQGKVLYDYIQDVSHIGHFLALWDASTGLPVTDPETSPYIYNTGDFYTVSVVASGGGTNYKPDGTQYVIGQASTAVDTDGVEVNDFYFYDGQVWRHMKNSGAGSIAVDGSLSTTSTNPVENRVITNALNGKADATDINTKTFFLSSDSDLTTAQAAYDWYLAGKNPIIDYQNGEYFFHGTMSGGILFLGSTITTGGQYTGTSSLFEKTLLFNVSNGTVTSIVDTIRNNSISYIDTITPTTAFTPTHDWQPATKKYVDDHAGTTYTAGANIQISAQNVISATDTKYTAGTGISIDANNVISNTQTSAEWGNITGTLSDQTDLQNALDEKQDKLTAGEGIEIRNGTDYSAMRGPCPSGYHIPSANEWDAVCSTLTTTFGFASSATTIGTYLKMPMAGDRDESTSNIEYAGERGFYRTSTPYSISHAYNLGATSSALSSGGKSYRAHGYPLRGFKDEPVAPDNTWTTLYDGSSVAAGAGVFRNSSLGLISLSGDGTTWTTIMDKNIGATDTDITSTDSYGYYYQWGNNYGFATTGSVTTSSTQVDTTGYGPGNYYNNSTFIQVAIDGDWSSVQNDNLWGGVTGAVILNNAITNTGVLSVNGEVGNVSIAKIITGTTYAQLGERLAAYLNEKGATPATYTDMGLVGIWDANLYYFQGFSTVTAGSQYRFTFQSLVTDTTTVSGSYNRTSHKLRRFVLNRDSTQSVWSYDSHDTNYIMIASNNYLQTNVDYATPYTPQYDGSPATKKYVDDSVNLKSFGAFPGSGLSDLQDLYDWLVSGNYAQVTYQNQVYIFGPTNVTTGDVESYVMRETNISSNESGVLDMKDTMLTFAVSDGTVTGNYGADSTTTGQGRIIYVNSAAGQPSNPQASSFWYDTTNNKLKVYDGSNWNVVGDDAADINTKTFTISSTSDLTNAQAAYDWYLAGKNPIVKYGDNFLTCAGVWQDAIPATKYYLAFTSTWVGQLKDTDSPARWAQAPNINNREILLEFANDVVSAIIEDYTAPAFLPTNSGVEILYTPYYDWDPATKGYVDDTIATAYEGGPGIAVGMIHSDRQGPCPDGWHVPSQAEWAAIITAGDTMSAWSTGTDVSTKLKLPFAGYRSYSDGNVSNSGSTGYYWSSDCTTATDTAYQLQISSSVKNASAASIRSYGAPIRAIKDKPIIPDAGWVTIYDGSTTATGAGVFRESTEGLISISADGTTWYTIMDKNLGASSVWESGVTLSSYNCGYYYQRGNNYGFAGIGGTVTTTSNRQSANGYGPQNPYSYSSFITYLGNWDTSNNKNLWGGVTNGTRFGEEGTMIVNTGVTSVNGQTGDVTVTGGDMNYVDFNWQAKTGATVTLDLASTITPTANFTVNAPSTIKDGQTYILRVNNGATAYTMTLGTNITNPYQESLALTADGIDQFVFLAIGGNLELQPIAGASIGDYVESVNGTSGPVTLKTINNTAIVGSGNIAVQATLSNITAAQIKTGTATTQRTVTAAALAGGLIRISDAENNILANGGKLWAGTQENYEALSSYDEDTVYLTI